MSPQLDIMYCNCNICNYVLYRGLWPPANVYCHNKVSTYGSTHSYFWVVCRCSLGTTVTITSVIMCCTEVCGHLVMSIITIKSLHIDLLIHISGWYADVLWAQLVHSFDQVVGRLLPCGHMIIHTVSILH